MSLEVNIHAAQTSILRELLFHPQAGYGELQKPTGLTSDHFNFHMSRLVELDLVEKVVRGRYQLTPRGKEYANRLDTDNNTIERQPKIAVILALQRSRVDSETEYLFQERRKNPYYGFWGFPSGKVRWGEAIAEAAARETLEETGLSAEFRVAGVYHELVRQAETSELLEDKVFFVVNGTDPRGQLVADFEGGHNEWLTAAEVLAKDKKYETVQTELDVLTAPNWLTERTISYNKQDF